MGKPDKKADGPRLEWTVSPWTANWKRPAGALAMCVILALLAGFSVNYPNYSVDTVPTTGQDAAVEERTPEEIAELTAYRDNWVGRSLIWSLFGVVLLVGMTASIYLPVRYRLDDRGVTTFFLWVPTTNLRRWMPSAGITSSTARTAMRSRPSSPRGSSARRIRTDGVAWVCDPGTRAHRARLYSG